MTGTLVAIATLLADHDPWDHHDGWGDGGGWWFFGMLMMTAWVALVALAVWAFARRATPAPPSTGPSSEARQILARRFAQGEIDKDEYQDRLQALEGS